jgi:hypothetical protein
MGIAEAGTFVRLSKPNKKTKKLAASPPNPLRELAEMPSGSRPILFDPFIYIRRIRVVWCSLSLLLHLMHRSCNNIVAWSCHLAEK